MKNLILLIIFVFGIYNFLRSQSGTFVNGTIKKDGSNCVAVYAKPNGTVTTPPSNYVFSVSIPDLTPYPSLTVTELLEGMVVDAHNPPPYNANGRRYYDFNMTQDGQPPSVNWASGVEYKIGKVCFANGGSNQLVQINDLETYGNNGFTVWYIEFQGPGDLTPLNNKYYASPGESTVSNGTDSYAETIAQISLPEQLISFEVEKYTITTSILLWTTSTEINSDYFGIERSCDSEKWESIGKVEAAGNSNRQNNYKFIDENLKLDRKENIFFYRLKMVDRDGTYKYSEVRNIVFTNDKNQLQVYPNPTKDFIRLDLSFFDKLKGSIEITVYDMNGKQVLSKVTTDTGYESIDIRALPANTYNIKVKQGDLVFNEKVIKVD